MTPYYKDAAVTIYHGDALEVLSELGSAGSALFLTDPPYFRVVDAEWDNQWGANVEAFFDWIETVVVAALRCTIPRATLAVFAGPQLACGVELRVRRHWSFLNHIVWRKRNPGRLGSFDKGKLRSFFPLTERIILAEKKRGPDDDLFRFAANVAHETRAGVYADLIERMISWRDAAGLTNADVDKMLQTHGMAGHYFGRSQWMLPTRDAWEKLRNETGKTASPFPEYETVRAEFDSRRAEFDSRRAEFDSRRREFDSVDTTALELLSDCWTFEAPPSNSTRMHPTQKPEPLIRHMIGTMSRPGDLVLDPFMGSGTTLRVAKDTGRRAIGIEKDERFCELAAERMRQEGLFCVTQQHNE